MSCCCCGLLGFLFCVASKAIMYVYPLSKTYETITDKKEQTKFNHIQWVTYWIIFANFLMLENKLNFLPE